MRAAAKILAVLLLGACASGGPVDPPAGPIVAPSAGELEAETVAEPMAEVVAEEAAGVEEAGDQAARIEAACLHAADLAAMGEHKPAVDALAALGAEGFGCEPSVEEAVDESRRRLAAADALASRGLEARRAGDPEAARELYRQALDLYPKYYWVKKLEEVVQPRRLDEVERLQDEAAELISKGRTDEALRALDEAASLMPSTPALAEEQARIRSELGDTRLAAAYRAERNGDLARAIYLTTKAIEAQPDYPVRDRVVDFSRQLGLKLFSAGELVEARSLWQAALSLDEGNALLRQYLEEVDSRLRSLEAIKQAASD